MLKILPIVDHRDQSRAFQNFDPANETWVVSDLKSKLDLNRRLLKERNFIPGEAVIRASELWKILVSRLRPDLQIVSREFTITMIAHKLARIDLDWAKAPGAAQAAYDYMTQFMPILAHPNGEEMMKAWLDERAPSRERWGRWFELSLRLWREFLEEGYLAPPWVSGVLVNDPDLTQAWSRPLYVDLGAELDQVEADLLAELASVIDVTVLRPNPTWADQYEKTLVAYDILLRKRKVVNVSLEHGEARKIQAPEFRKYTTMIAEVKDAVALCRSWLDQDPNLTPRQIAIVAPDIESYWPSLSKYLDQEGLPSQKDRVRRLHGFPDIGRWLATLRLRTGSHAEADVELGLFDPQRKRQRVLGFERFKVLYSTIYGREDLERESEVARLFAIEFEPGDEVGRDEFVAWCLKQFPDDGDLTRIETLFHRLFGECPQGLELSIKRWLAYLEQLAARVECRIRDGETEGIACINLSSAGNSPSKKMIVVGLTESNLRPSSSTSVLYSDILELAREFGFHLASEDQARMEFEARWLIENSERQLILSTPETDFAGTAQAPSWLWVRGAREAGSQALESLTIPNETRWDKLQKSDLSAIAQERKWSQAHALVLEKSLLEDLGERNLDTHSETVVRRLSPSAIEDYLNCPFVFAAKRLFSLSDLAELDLEVDPSRRGSLMHKLLELLVVEPFRPPEDEGALGALVDQARVESKIEIADERMWPPLKKRFVDLARRFIAFENEARRLYPETHTVAHEKDIAGFLRPETGELLKDQEQGTLRFSGRIDRIDQDRNGNLVIYDYKSSRASAANLGQWIKNNKIQLLLYAIAVENGLTSLDPNPVVGAFYYVTRPLSRDVGFKVVDIEQGLYNGVEKSKKNRLTSNEKQNLFHTGQELVARAARGILDGNFAPSPRHVDNCKTCQWSSLCRAPHLNR